MHDTLSPETKANLHEAHITNVWNALIPQRAVKVELKPHGVRYLHPTKGWKWVGKKRFAVRGVL